MSCFSRICKPVIFLALLGTVQLRAAVTFEDSSSQSPAPVSYPKLGIVTGTIVASMAAIHIYQQNGWWRDNRTAFHFQEDLHYGLWVDKIGHFHGASALTYIFSKSLQWAELPVDQAMWYGAGGSLLFQTYIEMEDGFSTWGFDRVDYAFDVGGSAWPLLQHTFPALREFDIKFSYHPSDLLDRSGGTGFQGQKHLVLDDYEGQTFWVSTSFKNILPKSIGEVVPEFLGVALGYGARDIVGTTTSPYSVWIIGLDIDTRKLIPDSSPFLKTLGESLNFFHLPMPAVQISPSAVWYGLYF